MEVVWCGSAHLGRCGGMSKSGAPSSHFDTLHVRTGCHTLRTCFMIIGDGAGSSTVGRRVAVRGVGEHRHLVEFSAKTLIFVHLVIALVARCET